MEDHQSVQKVYTTQIKSNNPSISSYIFSINQLEDLTQAKIILNTSEYMPSYKYEHSNSMIIMEAKKVEQGFSLYFNMAALTQESQSANNNDNNFKYIGRLESNVCGTSYILRMNPGIYNSQKRSFAVIYDQAYLKKDKPRSFEIYLNSLKLINKKPIYNAELNSYSLNFSGRVTIASVKNFQIVHPLDPTFITLTFGKESQNSYILDYTHPWSVIEAFCIGLTALDTKLGFE